MLGRFLAKRLGFVPERRPVSPAAQIARTANLPEVDCIIADRAIARALGHPKIIARDF